MKNIVLKLLLTGVCLLIADTACADELPLYQRLVEQAAPDADRLAKSEKTLSEHKDIKILDKLVIAPFHKQSGDLETAPLSFCRNCHSSLPHAKQLRTRTFNNMHVRFIACETCHFKPKGIALDYNWFDFEAQKPVDGKGLFRVGGKTDNAVKRPVNPKIAPFYQGQSVLAVKAQAFSESIADAWKNARGKDSVLLHAKLHSPLDGKGTECAACHDAQKSLLDFKALGASTEQASAIAKHTIPEFLRLYKKDDERITIRNLLQ